MVILYVVVVILLYLSYICGLLYWYIMFFGYDCISVLKNFLLLMIFMLKYLESSFIGKLELFFLYKKEWFYRF